MGTGEKLDDLEPFHPARMASRILGMGDVLTLIEKAQQNLDEEQAMEQYRKIKENSFDMNDLLAQMRQLRSMGPLQQVLSMLPGVGSQLKNIEIDDNEIYFGEAIILSMTEEERRKPAIINPSRKRRIAAGSGRRVEDVNKLLKMHRDMQKMMKQVTGMNKGGKMGKKRRRGLQLPPGFPGMS